MRNGEFLWEIPGRLNKLKLQINPLTETWNSIIYLSEFSAD